MVGPAGRGSWRGGGGGGGGGGEHIYIYICSGARAQLNGCAGIWQASVCKGKLQCGSRVKSQKSVPPVVTSQSNHQEWVVNSPTPKWDAIGSDHHRHVPKSTSMGPLGA